MESGEVVVTPRPGDNYLGSVSLDLQLGSHFRVFVPGRASGVDLMPLDGRKPTDEVADLMDDVHITANDIFYLHPGDFALGVTLQRVKLPTNIVGRLDGRSSLARLGLMVHATAHTIDPGWDGNIVLEFFNCGRLPLGLRPGMRICALSFEELKTATSKPYVSREDAKYRQQELPLASRIGMDEACKKQSEAA